MSDKDKQVEAAANRYRTELLATLQELDRRRAMYTDVRGQVQAHKTQLYIVAGCAAGLVAAGIGLAVVRHRAQDARLRRERVRGLIRAWEHPRRVATSAPYRPLPIELLRKMAIAFGTALATNYARKAAKALFEVQQEERNDYQLPTG